MTTTEDFKIFLELLPNDVRFGWWCEESKNWENYPSRTRFGEGFQTPDEAKASLVEHIKKTGSTRDLRVWKSGFLMHSEGMDASDAGLQIEI